MARSPRRLRRTREDRDFRGRGLHPVRPTAQHEASVPGTQERAGGAEVLRGVDEDGEDQGEEGKGQQREGNEEAQEEAERDSLSHGMAMEAGAGDDPGGDGGLSLRRESEEQDDQGALEGAREEEGVGEVEG